MHFTPMITLLILSLGIFSSSTAIAQSSPSDIEIFQSCFSAPQTNQCTNADFNNDGLINIQDFSLIRSATRGDFNRNGLIDLRDAPDNQDLNFLEMCIEQNTQTDCNLADLNNDGSIDYLDIDVFCDFIIYDLNNDEIVDLSINTSPAFQHLDDKNLNEGEITTFYIWARDAEDDIVTYTLENAPENAIYTPVVMGDFNDDGIVSDQDVLLITTLGTELYDQRFDLNNDNLVDQQDIEILQDLVGTSRQALLFDWTPGTKDSGLYEILITVTDARGLTSQNKIVLTIYDIDALTNYYSYDDVLLIINSQSEASQIIGQYFSEARVIPASRIVTISTAENETISRQTFEQDIRLPIEQFISDNNLNSEINYIVTTKGVPLRVSTNLTAADHASVDSELSLISGPYADQIGTANATKNPYHQFDFPFSREMFGIFLVTRLTGYTVNDVLTLIDRSAQPEQFGTFVLDVDPSKDNTTGFSIANQSLRDATPILEEAGHFVFLDETNTFITDKTNVLGYASWGSNDANDTDNAKTHFVWLPGSIAETFVSTSARTFTPPATYGQSLIADLIAEGATGAKGYVYEPFLAAMAKPDILFDRYSSGYSLADSYFSASSNLGWQGVVVGDPKMAINYNIQSPAIDANTGADNGNGQADQNTGASDPNPTLNPDTQQTSLNITTKGSGSLGPWAFMSLLLLLSVKLSRNRKESTIKIF